MNYQQSMDGVPPNRQRQRRAFEEQTLKSEKLQIERKTFIISLKENPRGRFVRITEDVAGRRDSIILPATGIEDVARVMEEIVQFCRENPNPISTPPPVESHEPPPHEADGHNEWRHL